MQNQTFHLLLASQSPRRAQLLEQMGVACSVLAPQDAACAAELEALEAPLENEAAHSYVLRVAQRKLAYHLRALRQRNAQAENTWVLCADTTVSLDGTILGKPQDAADAQRILSSLSGREHQVFTSVCIACAGPGEEEMPEVLQALSRSEVRFAPLTEAQIQIYIASGEPFGKAGAYAIQGRAGMFVEHLSGSYSGIMGLPMYETANLLRQAGWTG